MPGSPGYYNMFSNSFQRYLVPGMVFLYGIAMYPQAQEVRDASLFYNWFDEKIGVENLGLYDGSIYTDNFVIVSEKHQFFNSSDLSLGTVTYNGQTYYDQQIKYDLYLDQLLITPKNKTSALLVLLESSRIDRFSIEGRHFIRVDMYLKESSKPSGFCEIIAKNNASMLVRKYRKTLRDRAGSKSVYQEFVQLTNFYLLMNDTSYSVNSKGEWISVFPKKKKAIKEFYKKHNTLKKTDMNGFMRSFFAYLFPTQTGQNTSF